MNCRIWTFIFNLSDGYFPCSKFHLISWNFVEHRKSFITMLSLKMCWWCVLFLGPWGCSSVGAKKTASVNILARRTVSLVLIWMNVIKGLRAKTTVIIWLQSNEGTRELKLTADRCHTNHKAVAPLTFTIAPYVCHPGCHHSVTIMTLDVSECVNVYSLTMYSIVCSLCAKLILYCLQWNV